MTKKIKIAIAKEVRALLCNGEAERHIDEVWDMEDELVFVLDDGSKFRMRLTKEAG